MIIYFNFGLWLLELTRSDLDWRFFASHRRSQESRGFHHFRIHLECRAAERGFSEQEMPDLRCTFQSQQQLVRHHSHRLLCVSLASLLFGAFQSRPFVVLLPIASWSFAHAAVAGLNSTQQPPRQLQHPAATILEHLSSMKG